MSNIKLFLKRYFVIALACFCMLIVFVPTKAEDSGVTINVYNYHEVITIENSFDSDMTYHCVNLDFTWSGDYGLPQHINIIDNPDGSLVSENGNLRILKEGISKVQVQIGNSVSDPITVEVKKGNYASTINLSDSVISLKSSDSFNLFSYLKDHMYVSDPANDLSDEISTLNLEVEKDPSLITIEENGNVQIHHRGSASIKVTTIRNEVYNVPVVVMDDPVQSFRFNTEETRLRKNYCNNMMEWLETDPSYAIDGIVPYTITWTSSDPAIASFDYSMNGNSNGYLSTHQVGDVTVTASWNNMNATMLIHVVDEQHHFSSNSPYIVMGVGNIKKLSYTIDSISQIVSKEVTAGTDVIAFDKETDTVTALKPGKAEITYTDDSNWPITYQIDVKELSEQIEINYSERKYVLRPENPINTDYANYTLLPENTYDQVTFTVVEGNGVVEIPDEHHFEYFVKEAGDAIIRATLSNGAYADLKIHAIKGTYAEWFDSTTSDFLLAVGDTFDLKKEFEKRLSCSSGSKDFADELAAVKFEPMHQSIVKISDDNTLTAVREGNTDISFYTANGEYHSFGFVVSNHGLKGIRFNETEFTISTHDQSVYMSNYLQAMPAYMNRLIDAEKVKWTSSDHSIAMFKDETDDRQYEWYRPDQLILTGKPGDVTITAEFENFICSTVIHVTDAETQFSFMGEVQWNTFKDYYAELGEKITIELEIGRGNTVLHTKVLDSMDILQYDEDTRIITINGYGNAQIQLTDIFGKTLTFNITVPEEPSKFYLQDDCKIGFRKDDISTTYCINYTIQPWNAQGTDIKWELSGDTSILETIDSGYGFQFRPLKPGIVTIKGTTENGLSDTCTIELVEGDFATSFDWEQRNIALKKGETLDLEKLAKAMALPKGAAFADEQFNYYILSGKKNVSINENGVLTALNDGRATISLTMSNGVSQWVNIAVSDGITGIAFEQDRYEFPHQENDYNSLSLKLQSDPSYAISGIDLNEIVFESSDSSIMRFDNAYTGGMNNNNVSASFTVYSEGTVTITAKYRDFTAKTQVEIFQEQLQTELHIDDEFVVKEGYLTVIPYSFGKKEKQECSISILDNSESIKLESTKSNGGEFVIEALKPGTTKVRVSSIDDPDLYKDVKIKVKKNASIDFNFQMMSYDGLPVKQDANGYYVMSYGEMYEFHMNSNAVPRKMKSIYQSLLDSGILTGQGGAAAGMANGVIEEFGSSMAGKVGSAEIEIFDGIVLKFRIVADAERADYGESIVNNRSGNKVNIDEKQLEKTQKKLSRDIADRIDNDVLQSNVTEISSNSAELLEMNEITEVLLDTNTTITLDEANSALVYEITPIVKVNALSSNGATSRAIGETTTDISKTIEMELPVGNFVEDPNKPVYVVHVKEDGTKYVYEGTYDPESKTVKVTNPHGFSTFQITQVKPVVDQSIGNKPSVDTSDKSDLILYAGIGIAAVAVMSLMFVIRKKHS